MMEFLRNDHQPTNQTTDQPTRQVHEMLSHLKIEVYSHDPHESHHLMDLPEDFISIGLCLSPEHSPSQFLGP